MYMGLCSFFPLFDIVANVFCDRFMNNIQIIIFSVCNNLKCVKLLVDYPQNGSYLHFMQDESKLELLPPSFSKVFP
jgi:hypothetical protein